MITSITSLMLKEHKEINKILEDLEKNNEGQNPKKLLSRLKSSLERHFFIEEKIIFRIYSLNKNNEDILDLIKEHKDILWLVIKLEENQSRGLNLELSDIKELLESHIQFENEFFYPKLEELDKETQQLIIDRCKEASCKELDELGEE
jgi:iron-sulfur cluster repair protein YtfE (RIC family)